MACLCLVAITYLFSGTGAILYNVTMFAIYTFPLLIIVMLLVYVQMYRCLKQLSVVALYDCNDGSYSCLFSEGWHWCFIYKLVSYLVFTYLILLIRLGVKAGAYEC